MCLRPPCRAGNERQEKAVERTGCSRVLALALPVKGHPAGHSLLWSIVPLFQIRAPTFLYARFFVVGSPTLSLWASAPSSMFSPRINFCNPVSLLCCVALCCLSNGIVTVDEGGVFSTVPVAPLLFIIIIILFYSSPCRCAPIFVPLWSAARKSI